MFAKHCVLTPDGSIPSFSVENYKVWGDRFGPKNKKKKELFFSAAQPLKNFFKLRKKWPRMIHPPLSGIIFSPNFRIARTKIQPLYA